MSRKKPTQAELEILQVLWQEGSATVRTVNEQLSQLKPTGYTTTLKLMQIMHGKGLLARQKDGRTHIYTALVSEADTQQQLVDRLLDTAFQGSAMKLVMQALGNRPTSRQELEELQAFLDQLNPSSNDQEDPSS